MSAKGDIWDSWEYYSRTPMGRFEHTISQITLCLENNRTTLSHTGTYHWLLFAEHLCLKNSDFK